MSTLIRKLIFCLIGLLSGLAAWPFAELILSQQASFPSYLIFTLCLGMVIGAIMGGFLGSVEGITLSIKPKILPGIITGTLVGIVGGAVGFLIGQGALLIVTELVFHSNKMLRSIGIPLSRVIGWGFLGMAIGCVEGIRALSWAKIRVGLAGGIIGGLLGGVALEYTRLTFPHLLIARLIGLLILGTLIGLFYGLFEKRFSLGVLKLLNGKLKGKEYLLVQRSIRIGSSRKADICIPHYKNIADFHAQIKLKRSEAFIYAVDDKSRVLVNEVNTKEHQLKLEDIIQIGSAKFLFFYK